MFEVDVLAFSDVHSGLPGDCLTGLVRALTAYRAKLVIINGDLFHNHEPVTPVVQSLIEWVNCQHDAGADVIFVRGNHDWDLEQRQADGQLPYATIVDEHVVEHQGRRVLFIHGHQFDQSLSTVWWMGALEWLEWHARAITGYSWLLQFFEGHSKWRTACDLVMQGAVAEAQARGYDVVICGHVHQACLQLVDGIVYGNTGCAVTNRPSIVCLNGTIELHQFTLDGELQPNGIKYLEPVIGSVILESEAIERWK